MSDHFRKTKMTIEPHKTCVRNVFKFTLEISWWEISFKNFCYIHVIKAYLHDMISHDMNRNLAYVIKYTHVKCPI